jgi:hypothetical protein
MDLDKVIFGKKKFSDLLKEIYDNQQKKTLQINGLINELKPLVNDIGDATLLVPLIKEYLDIGIRNDDLLIKMATIIQRSLSNSGNDNPFDIPEAEKEQLLSLIEQAKDEDKESKK